MVNPETVGRYIHGMILQDEDAAAISPPGSFSVHGNTSSFIVSIAPEGAPDSWRDLQVRVTVEVL